MNTHDLYVITGDVPTPIHDEPLTFRQFDAIVETITDENYVVWTLDDWRNRANSYETMAIHNVYALEDWYNSAKWIGIVMDECDRLWAEDQRPSNNA